MTTFIAQSILGIDIAKAKLIPTSSTSTRLTSPSIAAMTTRLPVMSS